jgi:hypothetical protein
MRGAAWSWRVALTCRPGVGACAGAWAAAAGELDAGRVLGRVARKRGAGREVLGWIGVGLGAGRARKSS